MTTKAGGKKWTVSVADWAYTAEGEDGPETRLCFWVSAEDEDGHVYRHGHVFHRREEAEVLASRVERCRDWVGPEVSRYWYFDRVAYGSPAYARDWRRLGAEAELSEREIELGPHAAYESLPPAMKMALC